MPPHLTKGSIGNYYYGLNIEHAKPVLEEDMIVNSLLGELPTATKHQRGGKGVHAFFLVHVYKSLLK